MIERDRIKAKLSSKRFNLDNLASLNDSPNRKGQEIMIAQRYDKMISNLVAQCPSKNSLYQHNEQKDYRRYMNSMHELKVSLEKSDNIVLNEKQSQQSLNINLIGG
jgi:hypothetical protein